MDRVLRLWSAVSWWLVPLAIIALGAVAIAQNDSLFSEGSNTTFDGPVVVHAAFLLLVTIPLCWRFRAPIAVVILVTASSGAWILAMFKAQDQHPFEPALAIFVALFALASRRMADHYGRAPRSPRASSALAGSGASWAARASAACFPRCCSLSLPS